MSTFKVKVITPDRVFYDGEVQHIVVRTTEGDTGILKNHENYVASLQVGEMKMKIDDEWKHAALADGVIKVGKDVTTILSHSCEWADEIDVDRAKKAQEKARASLESKKSDQEFDIATLKLKRAINRINIANRW